MLNFPSQSPRHIRFFIYLLFSSILVNYVVNKYVTAFNHSLYQVMIASFFLYAVLKCVDFLNIPLKPETKYCLTIFVCCSGLLSQMLLTFFFQAIAVFLFFRYIKRLKSPIVLLALLFLSFATLTYRYFGRCQWDQILTLFEFGQSGLLTSDFKACLSTVLGVVLQALWLYCFVQMIKEMGLFFLSASIPTVAILELILSCAVICYLSGFYDFLGTLLLLYRHLNPLVIFLMLIFSLLAAYLFMSYKKFAAVWLLMMGLMAMDSEFQFLSYSYYSLGAHDSGTDYFHEYYKDPSRINFHLKQQPKNLILIYVESLEANYQDKTLFKRDFLKSLNALDLPKTSFNHFIQAPNTGWTMAGIIASQCGVPYKLSNPYIGNMLGQHLKSFMPHASCLGDILSAKGYTNIFLNGSSLDFAGQGLFFKTHHYDEIYGRTEWQHKGYSSEDLKFWGLSDDNLFAEAKLTLNRLMQAQKPFNLTLLTIDTHGIDGRLSKTCLKHGGRTFEDIVECTSTEVAGFIAYVAKRGWLDRVTIVVTGDHLVMANAISHKLNQSQDHYIYNLLISNAKLKKTRDNIVHFDLLPSILQALGFSWGDDRLGLGYSAFGLINPGLEPEKRLNQLKKTILSNSTTYNKLW